MQKKIPYTKWSPARNTTLFFPLRALSTLGQETAEKLAANAMLPHILSAEQVGFIDTETKTLRMAGGEFCLNATRAFGAHLHRLAGNAGHTETYTVTVTGWPDPITLRISGTEPLWHVSAYLTLSSEFPTEIEAGMHKVALPGITHILLDETLHPFPQRDPEAFHEKMRSRLGLTDEACVGLIWYRQENNGLRLTPLVHVRDTGSTVLENSCGSGSLALALIHGDRTLRITQPCGAVLTVERPSSDTATVSGEVTLVAEGTLWLDAID